MSERNRHNGRTELKKASLCRREDAKVLMEASRWKSAMYMVGYHVECALKARLMEIYDVATLNDLNERIKKLTKQDVETATHSIEILARLHFNFKKILELPAGKALTPREMDILAHYRAINQWSTTWRYKYDKGSQEEASRFVNSAEKFVTFIENSG